MKKNVLGFITTASANIILATSAFAESCTCADGSQGTKPATALLGDSACDCNHGEAIISILNLVVNIMTIGIGILGVIGITVVGIQYLTAGGDEGKTRNAKRRLSEIIIGLAAYVLIYAILDWLIPGFKPLGS